MEFTQANLATLNKAIASGRLAVECDGEKITYRSLNELLKARDLVKASLAAQSSTPRTRGSIASFSRG